MVRFSSVLVKPFWLHTGLTRAELPKSIASQQKKKSATVMQKSTSVFQDNCEQDLTPAVLIKCTHKDSSWGPAEVLAVSNGSHTVILCPRGDICLVLMRTECFLFSSWGQSVCERVARFALCWCLQKPQHIVSHLLTTSLRKSETSQHFPRNVKFI